MKRTRKLKLVTKILPPSLREGKKDGAYLSENCITFSHYLPPPVGFYFAILLDTLQKMSNINWYTFDGVSLAYGLLPKIKDELESIAREARNSPEFPNHHLGNAVTLLIQEPFPSPRFEVTLLKRLIQGLKLNKAELGALLNLFEKIRQKGFFYFDTIEALHGTLGKEAKILLSLPRLKDIFLELFLLDANKRLQRLYRVCRSVSGDVGSYEPYKKLAYGLVERIDAEKAIAWLSADGDIGMKQFIARLSRIRISITQVKFRFTYRCNIECRHCYNRSSPRAHKREIDMQDMLNVVREMASEGIMRLNVTGGEPMLFPETVCELLREARRCGIPEFSIVTNGFWGMSAEMAGETLLGLQHAGFHDRVKGQMDWMQISSGAFHQEFIPLESALTAADVYFAFFGVPADFHYEALHWSQERKMEVTSALMKCGMEKKVRFIPRKVVPIGRGSTLQEKNARYPRISSQYCSSINQIVFDPDGRARPCCGMNAEIDGLVFGNIRDGLKVLCRNMVNDPLLQFISQRPFDSVYTFIGKEPRPESRVSSCLLCSDAFKDKASADFLRRKLSPFQEFYPFDFM